MQNLFLVCAILGGAILVLQLLAAALGGAHGLAQDAPHDVAPHGGDGDGHAHGSHGLHLFSVRALTAGLAFFGSGGLAALALGLGSVMAAAASVLFGGAAIVTVAVLTRAMLKLEDDGTVVLSLARGATGSVYLGIPAEESGKGKVHLTLQNRTVELQAVTRDAALPTGASVLVVDVIPPDVVVVVSSPIQKEETHVI